MAWRWRSLVACAAVFFTIAVLVALVPFDVGSYYCGSPIVPRGDVLICERARRGRWLVIVLVAGFGVAVVAVAMLLRRRRLGRFGALVKPEHQHHRHSSGNRRS